MNIGAHVAYFANGIDPTTWFRMVRVIFLFICAGLMWLEPMMCGGRNRPLHRLFALFFAGSAVYTFFIAKARMVILTTDPRALASVDLLAAEILMTAAVVVIIGKLGYDLIRFRTYNKVNHQPVGECCKHFVP